jgi:hypothetical protein
LSAEAQAHGLKKIAGKSIANKIEKYACTPNPELRDSTAPVPKTKTGTKRGSTNKEIKTPPPLSPRVRAEAIAPKHDSIGVPIKSVPIKTTE